jgi:hypothetical protein
MFSQSFPPVETTVPHFGSPIKFDFHPLPSAYHSLGSKTSFSHQMYQKRKWNARFIFPFRRWSNRKICSRCLFCTNSSPYFCPHSTAGTILSISKTCQFPSYFLELRQEKSVCTAVQVEFLDPFFLLLSFFISARVCSGRRDVPPRPNAIPFSSSKDGVCFLLSRRGCATLRSDQLPAGLKKAAEQ